MVSASIGLTGAALLASLALSAPAGAAQASGASSLRVTGGARKLVSVCGRRRLARVVTQGSAVSARARVRLRRRAAVLAVDRCSGRHWTRIRRGRLPPGRRPIQALPTDAVGDLRVRLRIRRRTRTAYLHVTEDLVDVPVKFQVTNVN